MTLVLLATSNSPPDTAGPRITSPRSPPTKTPSSAIFFPDKTPWPPPTPISLSRMDRKGDEFFQTAIWGPSESSYAPGINSTDSPGQGPVPATAARTRTERLELVIGSGGKGQNYLFWRNDELFQLPVGYSTVLHHWINSPGYRDGSANFDRPIVPRCLECHAGYFDSTFPGTDSNLYDTKNYVLGIPANAATDLVASTSKPINNL